MNLFLTVLLQAKSATGTGGGSMIIFIVLMILIFYFFMIRPQQKKQKEMDEFKNSMQKGDKVTTVGGIHGKIKEIKETTYIVEIDRDVCIEIEKGGISFDEAKYKSIKEEKKNEKK